MRVENDYLGSMEIPEDALYGIHSARAKQNFPDTTRFHLEWFQAMGLVKQACYHAYSDMVNAVNSDSKLSNSKHNFIPDSILKALTSAASEIHNGSYFDNFIVPAIQGGAGTSINMNVNEIIANASQQKLGHKPGTYSIIDPIEHANIYQSTNDVVPRH